jgi:hypothetical protein
LAFVVTPFGHSCLEHALFCIGFSSFGHSFSSHFCCKLTAELHQT